MRVELVAVQPGGVDQELGGDGPARSRSSKRVAVRSTRRARARRARARSRRAPPRWRSASVVVNGQRIPSPGISRAPERPGPEGGLAPVELIDCDQAGVAGSRSAAAVACDLGEGVELLVGPGHHQRAGRSRSGCRPAPRSREQLVAAREQLRLERAGLGVEAGVQDRGVGLARPGADVRPGLDQHARDAATRQLARDRRADHAGADDRDVEGPVRNRALTQRPRDVGCVRRGPLAALEHPPALVVGDDLVEQPLLGAAVVEVVLAQTASPNAFFAKSLSSHRSTASRSEDGNGSASPAS